MTKPKLLADYPLALSEDLTEAYAFQLKGPRQKDHYSTLAVFDNLDKAVQFFGSFPAVPGCSVRLITPNKEIICHLRYNFKACSFSIGSIAWMIEQSKEIKTVIVNEKKEPKLPRFSVRHIANKALKSFQQEASLFFGFSV